MSEDCQLKIFKKMTLQQASTKRVSSSSSKGVKLSAERTSALWENNNKQRGGANETKHTKRPNKASALTLTITIVWLNGAWLID